MKYVAFLPLILLAACATSRSPVPPEPVSYTQPIRSAAPLEQLSEGLFPDGSMRYHHEQFGFTMQFPERLRAPGSCPLRSAESESMGVGIFEDGQSIYVAPTIYGELIARVPSDPSAGYDCVRIRNALPTIHKKMTTPLSYPYGWRMVVGEGIDSDASLLTFVRNWYSDDCAIGTPIPVNNDQTLEVHVTECEDGRDAIVKYAPTTQIAVTWKMGTETRFDGRDAVIAASFRFE